MRINGEEFKPQNPLTLAQLLQQRGCVLDRVAVELNGEIVPKASYETTHLSENDSIEIVSFVGGG